MYKRNTHKNINKFDVQLICIIHIYISTSCTHTVALCTSSFEPTLYYLFINKLITIKYFTKSHCTQITHFLVRTFSNTFKIFGIPPLLTQNKIFKLILKDVQSPSDNNLHSSQKIYIIDNTYYMYICFSFRFRRSFNIFFFIFHTFRTKGRNRTVFIICK